MSDARARGPVTRPPSESFEIRVATAAEYAEVGEITVRAYTVEGFLEPADAYAHRLRDAAARAVEAELWVAVEPGTGRLLGSVTFCPRGSAYRELAGEHDGEFRMLAVDPRARGLGVGRALVERCLERSRELGDSSVVICSLPAMRAAHRLYSSLGFDREPALDWSPVPGVELLGFRHRLVYRFVSDAATSPSQRREPAAPPEARIRVRAGGSGTLGCSRPMAGGPMSKTGRKRRARRKNKANHGKRPNT